MKKRRHSIWPVIGTDFYIKLLVLCFCLPILATAGCGQKEAETVYIGNLRTEYRENPIGIDEDNPRFSWQMASDIRGQQQSAYQVLVGDSAQNLAEGVYVWDSGMVESGNAVDIRYAGEPLKPCTRYYWQVKVWDKDDKAVLSTQEAYFETALMDGDWSDAQWIAPPGEPLYDSESNPYFTVEAVVRAPEGDASIVWGYTPQDGSSCNLKVNYEEDDTVAVCWYRENRFGEWTESGGGKTDRFSAADLQNRAFKLALQAAGQKLTVYIDDEEVASGNFGYTRGTNCGFGMNAGRSEKAVYYQSFRVIDDTTGQVLYDEDFTDPYNTIFGEVFIDRTDDGWYRHNGAVIATPSAYPAESDPAPMMRKEFTAKKGAIESARLYATAAGIYDFYINGEKISDTYFNPGAAAYNIRSTYQTFDVTDLVNEGGNAMGLYLGHGWYDKNTSTDNAGIVWGDHLAFLGKLVITYENGQQDVIVTDDTWKVYGDGPIRTNSFWQGEVYKADKEVDGWCEYGFADDTWQAVSVRRPTDMNGKSHDFKLAAQFDPPVRVVEILEPVLVTEPKDGCRVYDFGQELTGVVRVTVKGTAGDVITMRHGEWLNEEHLLTADGSPGTVYTRNLLGAQQTNQYFLKGAAGGETYSPVFTYQGFRYMEFVDLDESVEIIKVEALALSSDMERTGCYETSNEWINQLYSNAYWSQVGNFTSLPTDCPQRTERFGWSGDAQIFSRTASYNANVLNFYADYVQELADTQREDGAVADMAPRTLGYVEDNGKGGSGGNNGWGDAIVIITWNLYQQYGTTKIIEDSYEGMSRWVEYLVCNSTDWVRPDSGYGDHLTLSNPARDCVNTAWSAYSCELLSKMAAVIGKTEDAARFLEYHDHFKDAWIANFVNEDGTTTYDTQTTYVMGLAFDLFPEELRESAASRLASAVEWNQNHLTTGFAGLSFLNPVLSDVGRDDLAYALLEQEEAPGWLYNVLRGATTSWEDWNAYSVQNEAGDYYINGSLNHFAYGSVAEWMYRYSAGIERDEEYPGFKHFILQPSVGGSLTYVKGSYDSVYGTIVSAWTKTKEGLLYEAAVPANTTATLHLPAGCYLESGVPVEKAEGVTYKGTDGGDMVFELQSGEYSFLLKEG